MSDDQREGMTPPPAPGVEDSAGIHVPPPIIYAGAIVGGFLAQWLKPEPIVADGLAGGLRIAGGVIAGIGVLMALTASWLFRRAGTSPIPFKPTKTLVFRGPYRFTRNPMYLSLTFVTLGFAFWFNVAWILLGLIAAVLVIDRMVITKEESYLERRFGDAYLGYKARVRRWL